MQLPIPYISEELIDELELLEPFGKGNPKPLFAEKNLKVIQPKIIGKNHNVLKFQAEDAKGSRIDAIYFGEAEECLHYMQTKKEMAFTFYPSVNEYMGRKTLQMVVVNYK